ncbi:MAG: hypothetical protein IPF99_32390 [Deltaproteobacteria bacterium]|nr:hypothetical protein [Deltaproteobacteria bacterium]MBK7065318.1 hypothetical protein [Deltaproteobacteria bacterium]
MQRSLHLGAERRHRALDRGVVEGLVRPGVLDGREGERHGVAQDVSEGLEGGGKMKDDRLHGASCG